MLWDFIMVCTYEAEGANPELLLYKKRQCFAQQNCNFYVLPDYTVAIMILIIRAMHIGFIKEQII